MVSLDTKYTKDARAILCVVWTIFMRVTIGHQGDDNESRCRFVQGTHDLNIEGTYIVYTKLSAPLQL